jgi:hypothetical protein
LVCPYDACSHCLHHDIDPHGIGEGLSLVVVRSSFKP